MTSLLYPLTLYYDASCPLCKAEMDNLRLRDTRQRLCFVDASAPGFDAAPPGVSVAELMTLMHARTASGQVLSGVPAFELAYGAVDLPIVVALLRAPVLRPLAIRLYPHIARHRQRLPRWLAAVVFGRALRHAAERAARQHCAVDGCAVDTVERRS